MVGHFWQTVGFGGGVLTSPLDAGDVYVAKFDANGNHLWSKQFGGVGDQLIGGAALDAAGNIFLTGHFATEIDFGGGPLTTPFGEKLFLAKLDASGNHVWSQAFDNVEYPRVASAATDGAGNVIITGSVINGSIDFGGGPLPGNYIDVFVAKFDPSGNHVWSKRFGNADTQVAHLVMTDGAGNVVLGGTFVGSIDLGGGYLFTGGGDDLYLGKLDVNGDHVWSLRLGGTGYESLRSGTVDPSGNLLLAGGFSGTVELGTGPITSVGNYDAFVTKRNPDGLPAWVKAFGSGNADFATGIATDVGGNVVVAGTAVGTVDFGGGALPPAGIEDVLVAKLDSSGNHVWSKRFGDGEEQLSGRVVTDGLGNVLLNGRFQGSIDFGSGPLASAGSYDVFLAKLGP